MIRVIQGKSSIDRDVMCMTLPTTMNAVPSCSNSSRRFASEKTYEISITLNASFNQVEQLKAVSTYDGAEIFEEISERGA